MMVPFLGIHLMKDLKVLIVRMRHKRSSFWYLLLLSHNWFMGMYNSVPLTSLCAFSMIPSDS